MFTGYTIVSDMDGTLLDSEGNLSEENIKAIEEFTKLGGKFTLATGRMLASVKKFMDRLNVNLPVILYNGTKIYDFKNNEIIFEGYLEDERKPIIKSITKNNPTIGVEIYCEEKVYIYQSCKYTHRFSRLGYDIIHDVDESIFDKKWTKVLIVGEEDEIDIFESTYKDVYGDVDVIRSGDKYFELIGNNISKGKALDILCKKFDIDKEKLITIGDNMNDLELIKMGTFGYCVENGADRLKKEAEYIAPPNDEHIMPFLIEKIKQYNCNFNI